jgi:hypothetical protein
MVCKFLTFVMILSFFGCEAKKYEKSENNSVTLVEELNQGKTEEIIHKLSNQDNITSRERAKLSFFFIPSGT